MGKNVARVWRLFRFKDVVGNRLPCGLFGAEVIRSVLIIVGAILPDNSWLFIAETIRSFATVAVAMLPVPSGACATSAAIVTASDSPQREPNYTGLAYADLQLLPIRKTLMFAT